ncbi:transporter [Streptomyces diacarni]|uniref:Transporter n=1 Tax=Streptomyces diacarni TaxID=2800381 RepID=A0A367F8W3_9ACTN|nr:transporter [Streptomyces diacarni]RCG26292.1 transporter [Streptomyces diacarni]
MGDLKVFRVRGGRATEIPGASVAVERELQSLIEANMEAMLGIRFLASEHRTGRRHRGRVDSLGLDESGTPVIIEYKRSRDQNVINQALSYLVWLRDHRHEFERLVADRLGGEAAGAVDWSNPRVMCVAGEFTYHDTVAVEEIGRRIDLVSYRIFDDVLTLRLIASVAGAGGPSPRAKAPTFSSETGPGPVPAVSVPQQRLEGAPAKVKELFGAVDERLLLPEGAWMEPQQHYLTYRRLQKFASLRVLPRKEVVAVNLKLDPATVELEEGFTRDVTKIGCLGISGVEVSLRSRGDLERAEDLILRSIAAS